MIRWCFFKFPYGITRFWKAIPNLFVNNMDHLPIHKFKYHGNLMISVIWTWSQKLEIFQMKRRRMKTM